MAPIRILLIKKLHFPCREEGYIGAKRAFGCGTDHSASVERIQKIGTPGMVGRKRLEYQAVNKLQIEN